jgi:2-methylcitrate dehydratase PrpD
MPMSNAKRADEVKAPQGLSRTLCRYATGLRFEDVPDAVVDRIRIHFIDFLAVALGGRHIVDSSPVLIRAMRRAGGQGGGTATIVGEEQPASPQYAAFLNAAFAHSMDFDDTHQAAVMHPGATIFATLLALAEDRKASGADFVTASVAGYDVANKIGKAHGAAIHQRGFHPTATTGIFACTLAGARLVRLPLDQTENAFGLNVSQAAGAHQYHVNGSWDKRAHTGFAAHQAILSLILAEEGYYGSTEPIEGEYGYFALFAEGEVRPELALEGLGKDFEVMQTGLKPYPACRCSHSTIDVIREVVQREKLSADQIARISISLGPFSAKLVSEPGENKRAADTLVDAQFSIYFATAVAMREDFGWSSYAQHMHSPETRSLIKRIDVHVDESLSQYGTRVVIEATDGRSFEEVRANPRGEPETPLTLDEVANKFRDMARPTIGAEKAEQLLGLATSLDRLADLSGIASLLR